MEHKISDCVKNHTGKYLLVNALAKRMRDLQSGYKSLVSPLGKGLEDVALDEFRQDKIRVETRAWTNETR